MFTGKKNIIICWQLWWWFLNKNIIIFRSNSGFEDTFNYEYALFIESNLKVRMWVINSYISYIIILSRADFLSSISIFRICEWWKLRTLSYDTI